MNKKVIINTLKIVAAAVVAILLASLLKLDFAVSAGIVAILSVAPTKKETFKTALGRFLAFIFAIAIAFICFNVGGFNVYSFFVYLVVFILICQAFGWLSAMAMDSVLISHFLTLGNMSWGSVCNEVLLFIIGVTLGIIVNLHLHKNVEKIESLKDSLDDQIKHILLRMSERVIDSNLDGYDGSCFEKLWDSLEKAEKVADKNYMNEIKSDETDKTYINMRRNQIAVLYEMYKKCRGLKASPDTAKAISDFLRKVSQEYSRDNTVETLLLELDVLRKSMKEYDLPEDRVEFEDRAKLYAMLQSLKEFLEIKREFMSSSK